MNTSLCLLCGEKFVKRNENFSRHIDVCPSCSSLLDGTANEITKLPGKTAQCPKFPKPHSIRKAA